MKKYLILISLIVSNLADASVYQAARVYVKTKGRASQYNKIASELVKEGIYYAAIPFVKDYLVEMAEQGKSSDIDPVIDKIIENVGVKQFELLPLKILRSSNSSMMRYIRAKKFFRAGKYKAAYKALKEQKIPTDHSVKPFALLLEASILTILNKPKEAILAYQDCQNVSSSRISKALTLNEKKQLEINRDYCILGLPRTQYAQGEFDKASFAYLDLPKNSYVWPEVLFEEAWTSFYQKNPNRTLGKLVTYKAPVFDHVFNPEINVLSALSYMELCLWEDASKEVDYFYETYRKDADELKRFLVRHQRDYKFYYQLARTRENKDIKGTKLLNKLLNSIIYDPTYNELLDSFVKGKNEITYLKKLKLGRFKNVALRNVRDALIFQRDLVGRYIRKILIIRYGQLFKAFEGMSYIKLEVLSRKKDQIYKASLEEGGRARGDISYLKRNDKQYFWSFNGEFWADELGDYVFALKNECTK